MGKKENLNYPQWYPQRGKTYVSETKEGKEGKKISPKPLGRGKADIWRDVEGKHT